MNNTLYLNEWRKNKNYIILKWIEYYREVVRYFLCSLILVNYFLKNRLPYLFVIFKIYKYYNKILILFIIS